MRGRADSRQRVIFAMHTASRYGMERIALSIAGGLLEHFQFTFIAPPGPALEEARAMGCDVIELGSSRDFLKAFVPIWKAIRRHRRSTFVGFSPRYTLVCKFANLFCWRRIKHVQIVQGGGTAVQAFGNKKIFNHFNVRVIACSDFVRQKLIEFGLRADRIHTIYNFLPNGRVENCPRHATFTAPIATGIMSSRMDPLKRLDLLLDAEESRRELADFPVKVIGDGRMLEDYRRRAATRAPSVHFAGYTPTPALEYSRADLLIHTCAIEAFGLVVLEAMAANIPVLVPDEGGPATIVEDGVSGFKYRANDAAHLAERILELRRADPAMINEVVTNARNLLKSKFSARENLQKYRDALAPCSTAI